MEDDDDSDDADELPIHFRPRPAKEPNAATEPPAVLKKSQSKPRYSFVQDYLARLAPIPLLFFEHRLTYSSTVANSFL